MTENDPTNLIYSPRIAKMLTEDERYRTSSQYRLWSYTAPSLQALRTTTNRIASDRVREAVRRVREARAVSSTDTSDADRSRSVSIAPDAEVECLTAEEELELVVYYCRLIGPLGDHLKITSEVKSTAIQYIKRFYLTNSVMTYNPADILKTALYFSTKTENHYISIQKFAETISGTKAEDVLASEFLLTQALRFTFDVRHPFRALEGVIMDIRALAKGVPPLPGGEEAEDIPAELDKRAQRANGPARIYLKLSAQLTDAYFHFTPSQITMGVLLIVDEEMTQWYIRSKFPATVDPLGHMASKVLATVGKCAAMLKTAPIDSAEDKKRVKALSKKLNKCRNPEKMDLVGLQRAKREGTGEDEKVVKKRKLEREVSAKAGENLFGPALGKA